MASISVSEADFDTLSAAAVAAWEAGDRDRARSLDRLARKANAALTTARARRQAQGTPMESSFTRIRWEDAPSVLPNEGEDDEI